MFQTVPRRNPRAKPQGRVTVRAGTPLARGLVAFYAMNENTGNTLVDCVSNRNATWTRNVGSSPYWDAGRAGVIGQQWHNEAYPNNNASVTAHTLIDITSVDYSVSWWTWITGNGLSGYRTFMNRGGNGARKWYFLAEQSTNKLWRWDGFNSNIALSTGIWYHIVYTYQAVTSDTSGTETFYVREAGGTYSTANRTGTVPASSTADLVIAADAVSSASHPLQGRMDLLGIWKGRALTADDAYALWADPYVLIQPAQSLNFASGQIVHPFDFHYFSPLSPVSGVS